jgi:hypothetical protein
VVEALHQHRKLRAELRNFRHRNAVAQGVQRRAQGKIRREPIV